MSTHLSKHAFSKGLSAASRGNHVEALAYIEAAMRIEERAGARIPMTYLSYYGLSLSRCSNRLRKARELCERAVRAEFYNPDLYLNLGHVCVRSEDRRGAFYAFVRGLKLNSRHPGLVKALRRLGIRKRPVVRFLDRGNPINRVLAHLRTGTA